MIRLIEALGYRSLRDVRRTVGRFQLLVGPNASGKTTFLDVVGLLGDLLRDGISTLSLRSGNFYDLVWMKMGRKFELAIEAEIPRLLQSGTSEGGNGGPTLVRYEVSLGLDADDVLGVLAETLWLKPESEVSAKQRILFPQGFPPRPSIVHPAGKPAPQGWRRVVQKSESNDYFKAETSGWNAPFRFGPQRLALANLPEDEDKFPVAVWFRRLLSIGIQGVVLSGEDMRRPSPPGSPHEFQSDGSNLPWAIDRLSRLNPERFERWLDHVRTALPDIETVETIERPEDKNRYLLVSYRTGLKAPSWTVSDGTLRLLALTLVAYLDTPDRVYLIEEPENGIHPRAVETVYQALASTSESQILCATHSPVMLSLAEPESVLCFARTDDGATDIVVGSEHPNLKTWKRGTDLGTLFATGVLG
ncbi:MAG TPA: ATP-binding protein [Polyangia bacterium]|jgi:predicted ATPase